MGGNEFPVVGGVHTKAGQCLGGDPGEGICLAAQEWIYDPEGPFKFRSSIILYLNRAF